MMSPTDVLIGFTIVTCVFFNGVTAEAAVSKDPLMLLSCNAKVLISTSLDELNFTILGDTNAGVTYDEVGGHVYYGNGADIIKINTDGSNQETWWNEANGVRSVTIGPLQPIRDLYYTTYSNVLKRVPLNKVTGAEIVANPSYRQALFYTNSRVYITDSSPTTTLTSVDVVSGGICDSGSYENVDDELGSVNFDLADGKMYTTGTKANQVTIQSRDIGDFDGNTEVTLFDDLNIPGAPGGLYSNSGISSYGDWIYIIFQNSFRLARYPKTGGGAATFEFLEDVFPTKDAGDVCDSIYIYPGSTGGGADAAGDVNSVSVPVKQRRRFKGGFIADLDFDLSQMSSTNAEWSRIEVVFPRRVFNLKIVGCDVRIQRKEQTTGGRVTTTFTIVPESSDDAQGKTSFTMIGKIWRKLRYGTKAPIIADVYYNYDKVLNEVCSSGGLS